MTWKKWLKRTALAVIAYLILQTVWLVCERQWRWSKGNREVAQAFAETEATDPDWNWEALSAKRWIPPPEKNGAELIARTRAQLPRDWVDPSNPKKWEPDAPQLDPNQAFPAEMIVSLRNVMRAARDALEIARTFKDFPDGNRVINIAPDVWSTKLQDTSDTRLVATLVRWDTVLAVVDGDKARSSDNLLALLNVSRSLGDEPFLISQLVRISSRMIAGQAVEWVLGQTELDDSKLATLQQAWAIDAEEPLLLYGLRGDRATQDVFFRNMADGTVTPEMVAGVRSAPDISFGSYAWWLYRGRIPRERAFVHRFMTLAVDAARLPISEQPTALAALPWPPDENMKFARLFMPAYDKVAGAYWRSVAEARCLVVGLACERFRLKHERWPKTLAEIPKELLETIPLDPFDGQPLRYKRLLDGIVVYSIGTNREDEGGDFSHKNPPGPSADEGFRLWNTNERRKPVPANDVPQGID